MITSQVATGKTAGITGRYVPDFVPETSPIIRANRPVAGQETWNPLMAFILGVLFFVVVLGVLDAKLPWPRPNRRSGS
jgi:hypothetical protein